MGLEINHDVFMRQHDAIEKLLLSDKDNEKRVRKVIAKCVKEARDRVAASARSGLGMHSDPRNAAQAVRRSVYKQVLGAQINILSSRKRHQPTDYEPPRRLQPHQRGGNRVPRGANTKRYLSYSGLDRGFILNFLNNGTGTRTAGTRGGRLGGNRGNIAARNWFRGAAERELAMAVDKIARMIEEELVKK